MNAKQALEYRRRQMRTFARLFLLTRNPEHLELALWWRETSQGRMPTARGLIGLR